MEPIIIDVRNSEGFATYLDLHAQGYITLWAGEGKIAVVPPKPPEN